MDGDWERLPYAHPLGGSQQKLWRAKEHAQLLDRELDVFFSRKVDPAIIRAEVKPDDEHVFWWVVGWVNEPDLRLAAVVGEFMHSLRSSLDHLTFELSFLGTKGQIPGPANAFPCCYKRSGKHGWDSTRVQSEKLAGILSEHRAMIYRAQPCYRRSDARAYPPPVNHRRKRHQLADLEKLWNEDKHRMVLPVVFIPTNVEAILMGYRDCEITGEFVLNGEGFLGRPLKVDTEIYRLPVEITGRNPHVDVDFKLTCEASFANGLPIAEALPNIYGWVEGLLRWFQPVFETPQAKALWNTPRGGWVDIPLRMRRKTYRIDPPTP